MTRSRNQILDIAKGAAIILVVLGHVLQGMRTDFDAWLPFRLVYSFHMPLFIFLSGAVLSVAPQKPAAPSDRSYDLYVAFRRSVLRSAQRLLLPFLSWTIIGWDVNQREISTLTEWLVKVFRSPDNSLWFLLLVFECLLLWRAWVFAWGVLRSRARPGLGWLSAVIDNNAFSAVMFWLVMKLLVLRLLAGTPGISFVGQYLVYFIAGMLFWTYGRDRLTGWRRLLPYVAFVLLVPFWHRTEPLSLPFVGNRADGIFRFLVASAGILAVLDIAGMISRAKPRVLSRAMEYFGIASLGVYAIHYYFLGIWPPFWAALIGSLLVYAALVRIPILNMLLLGETQNVGNRKTRSTQKSQETSLVEE